MATKPKTDAGAEASTASSAELSLVEALSVMLDRVMFKRVKAALEGGAPLSAAEMNAVLKRLQRDGIAPAKGSGTSLDQIEQMMKDAGLVDDNGREIAGRIGPAVEPHEPKPPRSKPRSSK